MNTQFTDIYIFMCIIFIFTNLVLAKLIFKKFAYIRSLTQLASDTQYVQYISCLLATPMYSTQCQRYISYPSALAVQNTAIITSVHIPQTFSKQKLHIFEDLTIPISWIAQRR